MRRIRSTGFACPYEGPIAPHRTVRIAREFLDSGAEEVSIGDTIGVATPREVERLLEAARGVLDLHRIAFHFHDTRATGLTNVLTALRAGVRAFDAASGGVGGCPYAPGAGGNLATEDLVYLLRGIGYETGVDLDGVVEASRGIETELSHPLPSKVYRAVRAAAGRPQAAAPTTSGS